MELVTSGGATSGTGTFLWAGTVSDIDRTLDQAITDAGGYAQSAPYTLTP